jgi:hypothetical protein
MSFGRQFVKGNFCHCIRDFKQRTFILSFHHLSTFMAIPTTKDYLEKSGAKCIGTTANLLVAAAAGASTVIVTQVCYI